MSNMLKILSGDIGGTNTRLQLSECDIESGLCTKATAQYINSDFADLGSIIQLFLGQHRVESREINSACLAAAGPIVAHTVKFTNLPWFIDRDALRHELGIAKLELLNDFQAIGYGIELLAKEDKVTLQAGQPQQHAPKAIIGAGTGLGVAVLYWSGRHYNVIPTEGGHVDFAPTDDEQIALLKYMRKKFHRVSVERVVSGLGLTNIYKFVRDNPIFGETENRELRLAIHHSDDIAAVISAYALKHRDPMALRALNLFIRSYGSSAGNLALSTLCAGGLYLVGGIAPKLLDQLKSHVFLHAFNDKGRMSKLVKDTPVHVVLDTLVGLKGAALFASRL